MAAATWDRATWDQAARALVALGLLTVLAGFSGYGITWDEPLHVEYGKRALAWYLSLGRDRSLLEHQNLYLYGALFDVTAAALERLSPLDDYGTRRLLGGLVGLLGVAGAGTLARDCAGQRAGFLAALVLLLTPEWWGQSFANPKDVPVGTAMAWTLVFGLRAIRALPAPSAGTRLGLGLALGFTLGIRVGAGIIVLPLLLGAAVWLMMPQQAGCRLARTGRMLWSLAPPALLAWLVMLAFWPWAQLAPLGHPLQALKEFSRFPLDFSFPFWGVPVRSTDLPWWYLPAGFAAKLPEPALLGLALAAGAGVRSLARRAIRPDLAALAAAILLPPLLVILGRAVLYDGIRHFLFLLPPLAALAALGLETLLQRLPRRPMVAGLLLLAAWAGMQVTTLARLYPYETIWFNSLVGGPRGAEGRFELDGWGSALSEAARTLTRRIAASEGTAALERPYRVRVCGPHTSALAHLPPAWRAPADGAGPADFYLSFTRGRCPGEPDGPVVVRIERLGVLLAYAKDLRPRSAD